MSTKLYLATGNRHKAEELTRWMEGRGLGWEVRAADAVGGMPAVEENAADFAGNARLKARALAAVVDGAGWVLADDSGLCVDALDGAPGVHSARYAGSGASDGDNLSKLLAALEGVPQERRRAAFHCVLCLVSPEGGERFFEGICPGRIIGERRGGGGFGYDPAFVPEGETRTFAELGAETKDRISHRGRALASLAEWISRAPS